ncbi:MAG: hypothetical protein ACPHK7_00045 [Candidatus Thalassarchaeaceae archaeon]
MSNDDGVNGNAGSAGFAIDNIRIEEFTFEDDGTYTVDVNGMDASERQIVTIANHDFKSGIYRIDVKTLFDNTDPLDKWYNESEVNLANNYTTIMFSIASADITLMQPDILDCTTDITYACVYTTNKDKSGAYGESTHDFVLPLLNGVIEAEYQLTMKIVDLDTGQTVYEENADNGPFDLVPHQRDWANWTAPYDSWVDNHTYNISFYATFTDDGNSSGNERFFEIKFYDQIDVAILSNPTDQNRLQQVKNDLNAMNMTYTQLRVSDWDTYATPDWIEHYNKVLLPWQTDYNVVYGDYYEIMDTTREDDGLSVVDVLENFMVDGGTVQMHLGPYQNEYDPGRLIFDMAIKDRNQYNFTTDNRINYDDLSIDDPYHPILKGIDKVTFSGIHAGDYVAISGIDVASQVQANQIPATCGGRISVTGGTFHTLMRDTVQGHSLMSVCNKGLGGLIVTTVDVENPSVSESFGGENIPLLSNMLSYHLTPYPLDFGIAGTDFDLIINGESVDINPTTGAYRDKYIKSNADLDFTYVSKVEGLIADWDLESGNNDSVTGWDGAVLDAGLVSHTNQLSPSIPTQGSFCAVGEDDEPCRIGAEWLLTLYLHDDAGHTRITYIRLITNDTLADDFYPISAATIVHDDETAEYITRDGTKPIAGVDWPVYRVRLSDTGETTVKFTGENSTDPDAPQGETGIALYEWRVINDMPVGEFSDEQHVWQNPAAVTDEWSYTFRNITASPTIEKDVRVELIVYDKAGKQTQNKYRMYFIVVGENDGDAEPVWTFTAPRQSDSQSGNEVTIVGSILGGAENSDVKIEVSLDPLVLEYTPTQKITQKTIGKYNVSEGLGDGSGFSMTLDISDLYSTSGVQATLHFRITEGDGTRYTFNEQMSINLLPKDICEIDPDDSSCSSSESGGISPIIIGVGSLIAILAIVGVTLLLRSGRKDSDDDVVEQFGGVEQMDPVEAYVQQMVASGYDEQTARQYAEQYYASYYAQQQGKT